MLSAVMVRQRTVTLRKLTRVALGQVVEHAYTFGSGQEVRQRELVLLIVTHERTRKSEF